MDFTFGKRFVRPEFVQNIACFTSGMKKNACQQVQEFDRGRFTAYRECGLTFLDIAHRTDGNPTTVMRI
ncbi:hypothetical protein TNCV_2189081 [Trichonephila clavipes]|nr:hypothetical protein TNCV_2189081 [Trichonephila clavipes]